MQLLFVRAGGPFAVVLLALLVGISPACSRAPADVSRLQNEIDALRAEQSQMTAELAELKALLAQTRGGTPAGAPARTLTVANRPTRGSATARVTFIEYSDYGCQYCAQYSRDVYPRVIRDYVESGKIRYVFKNYPVEAMHPGAFRAHVAAACAGDQGRYWQMHDRLFATQENLQRARLVEEARRAGLEAAAFASCLAGTTHEALIRQDIDEAVRGGVNGTPVFVVAVTEPDDAPITPLRVVVGAQPYEALADAIDAVLATVGGGE